MERSTPMKRDTAFFCTECGNESAKWMGKCPACSAWNTLAEQPVERAAGKKKQSRPASAAPSEPPVRLDSVRLADEVRFPTGLSECDRVLGGGAVAGGLYLLAGDPGIGKSTLLMQICGELSRRQKVLYCSGEESVRQLRLRGERLGKTEMLVAAQTELEELLATVRAEKPVFLDWVLVNPVAQVLSVIFVGRGTITDDTHRSYGVNTKLPCISKYCGAVRF